MPKGKPNVENDPGCKAPLEVRFAARVRKGGPDECWEWQGVRFDNGYGKIISNGKQLKAHRLSWELANGRQIPEGLVVLHKCDNPPCCNPNHLTIGTHLENSNDKVTKRRHVFGERMNTSKLTADQVLYALRLRLEGLSFGALAKQFCVSKTSIRHAINGKNWRHLNRQLSTSLVEAAGGKVAAEQ